MNKEKIQIIILLILVVVAMFLFIKYDNPNYKTAQVIFLAISSYLLGRVHGITIGVKKYV